MNQNMALQHKLIMKFYTTLTKFDNDLIDADRARNIMRIIQQYHYKISELQKDILNKKLNYSKYINREFKILLRADTELKEIMKDNHS